jgi:hypothetical protein
MERLEIKVSKKTRMVNLPKQFISVEGENLQSELVFSFVDEFVNGQARLEYKTKEEKNFILLSKEGETYTVPVKNIITVAGEIDMQLVITEGTDEEEIPVFKSNKFYLSCNPSINAVEEAPDGYELWIEQANVKLNQIDEALLESETQSAYAKQQGDYAKEEATKVDEIVDYVVQTSDEANEKADTAISIAKGANKALDYLDYANMIANFNAFEKNKFNTGQNIMIKKLNVPDMWIYQLSEEYKPYTYTTDEEVINLLLSDVGFQVGYYVLSALETQKVDLTDYVKNTDYATQTKAGAVKIYANGFTGINIDGGFLKINKATNILIDAKENQFTPIVPYNLNYAVGSVLPVMTQAEYDDLETKDEDLYYFIVEE